MKQSRRADSALISSTASTYFPSSFLRCENAAPTFPKLVAFCLSQFSKRLGKKIDGVSRESMENLVNYPWPGNIRELQNVIERAVIVIGGPDPPAGSRPDAGCRRCERHGDS